MRTLIFGVILLAVGSVLFHGLISASLVAARDAEAATFSETVCPCAQADVGLTIGRRQRADLAYVRYGPTPRCRFF
jgi:hypothetical protein